MASDAVPQVGDGVLGDGEGQELIPPQKLLEIERQKSIAKLATARVASAHDREALASASKSDIHSIKVLGEGAFGLVDLVLVELAHTAVLGGKAHSRHVGSAGAAASNCLLCVRKKLLKQSGMNNNDPSLEVEFFQACEDLPFVVQMWSHVVGLYDYTLLLEYCPYGSLNHLLNAVSRHRSASGNACMDFLSDKVFKTDRRAGFSEPEARFYVACCLLGLESMHSRGLMHRDLKPANILVADNKYAKLGDLGLVKRLGEEGKAYTHVGTPGYMAPEIVHSKGKEGNGYSYPADIWSLGIVLWELVDGALPKWAIMSWYWTRLHFPEHFSPELCDLLSRMLEKSPSDRITLAQMRKHAWFKPLDWAALEAQVMEAPDYEELDDAHMHTKIANQHSRTTGISGR